MCTEAESTSIREEVEGESVCSISGGAGARFCGGVIGGLEFRACQSL